MLRGDMQAAEQEAAEAAYDRAMEYGLDDPGGPW
jgi:hypothetical protein